MHFSLRASLFAVLALGASALALPAPAPAAGVCAYVCPPATAAPVVGKIADGQLHCDYGPRCSYSLATGLLTASSSVDPLACPRRAAQDPVCAAGLLVAQPGAGAWRKRAFAESQRGRRERSAVPRVRNVLEGVREVMRRARR